jgi:lactate dehydrogenase-like 2-hydroxyacid dehydrogenase
LICSRIGAAVAKRLLAFDCTLLYYSRTQKPELASKYNVQYVEMDELLSRSDFVVPQVSMNPTSKHLFNAQVFAKVRIKLFKIIGCV